MRAHIAALVLDVLAESQLIRIILFDVDRGKCGTFSVNATLGDAIMSKRQIEHLLLWINFNLFLLLWDLVWLG